MDTLASQLIDAAERVQKHGVSFCVPVVVAQAILESDWGKSDLARKYNNYFGIKAGSEWAGRQVQLSTVEYENGKASEVMAEFRAYASLEKCFEDYGRFLAEREWFKGALRYPNDPKAYLRELQLGEMKYATDPKYESKILQLIDELHLL